MKAIRTHKINYNGIQFEVGLFEMKNNKIQMHQQVYLAVIWSDDGWESGAWGSRRPLRLCLNEMSSRVIKRKRSKELYALAGSLTKIEKIKHPNFAYARFKSYGGLSYYNIYWKDSDSPTGVGAVDGCTPEEWEELSKLANKENQYLAPNERW